MDFPIKNGGFFHSFLYVYQRVEPYFQDAMFRRCFEKTENRDLKKVSSFLQAFSSTVQEKPPKRHRSAVEDNGQDSLFVFGGLIVWTGVPTLW